MRDLSMHALGQMRRIDLLALAIEAGAAPSDAMQVHLGAQNREWVIDALTQPGASARLAERAARRLKP